jgi:hypothetical protein
VLKKRALWSNRIVAEGRTCLSASTPALESFLMFTSTLPNCKRAATESGPQSPVAWGRRFPKARLAPGALRANVLGHEVFSGCRSFD